jgi:hypothetical protein
MATYKTFNQQDIIISPLEVTKGFKFIGGNALTASDVGIERYVGKNIDFLNNRELSGATTSSLEYQALVYPSIKQLYYSNYLSGSLGRIGGTATASFNSDGTVTGKNYSTNYYNYPQTDLDPYKFFPTSSGDTIGILSIPKNLFGDQLVPKSIRIDTLSGSYIDDGEGRIKRLRPAPAGEVFAGNVIYQHGIIILTGGSRQDGLGGAGSDYGGSGADYNVMRYGGRNFDANDVLNFVTGSNVTCSFSSSFSFYETQYKCTAGESEFTLTQNPSIISSSKNGAVYKFATGSYFEPYITTVGLYDQNKDLLAVGKLAKPIQTSRTTDTTVLVNIDRQ